MDKSLYFIDPFIPMQRIVSLIDMDCFYVQVELRSRPDVVGSPSAVVQYDSIIAVSYEARSRGISRRLTGVKARQICPEIVLMKVPEKRGKADLNRYRDASREVMDTIGRFCKHLERASIDEAFIDLTSILSSQESKNLSVEDLKHLPLPDTFVVGWPSVEEWIDSFEQSKDSDVFSNVLLIRGAAITARIRSAIFETTGFKCSAGISHNKVLAKFACGINKPNKQTILPFSSVNDLFASTPINKIRNLGGKLGAQLKDMGLEFVGELATIPMATLSASFDEKTSKWLHDVGQGYDDEPVVVRYLAQSIGCGKNFPGESSLCTVQMIEHWVNQLSEEMEERLLRDRDQNSRIATLLTVTVLQKDVTNSGKTNMTLGYGVSGVSSSRSCALSRYSKERIALDVMSLVRQFNKCSKRNDEWFPPVLNMHLCASKFQEYTGGTSQSISQYMSSSTATKTNTSTSNDGTDELDSADTEWPSVLLSKAKSSTEVKGIYDEGIKRFFPKRANSDSNELPVQEPAPFQNTAMETETADDGIKRFFLKKDKPYDDDTLNNQLNKPQAGSSDPDHVEIETDTANIYMHVDNEAYESHDLTISSTTTCSITSSTGTSSRSPGICRPTSIYEPKEILLSDTEETVANSSITNVFNRQTVVPKSADDEDDLIIFCDKCGIELSSSQVLKHFREHRLNERHIQPNKRATYRANRQKEHGIKAPISAFFFNSSDRPT